MIIIKIRLKPLTKIEITPSYQVRGCGVGLPVLVAIADMYCLSMSELECTRVCRNDVLQRACTSMQCKPSTPFRALMSLIITSCDLPRNVHAFPPTANDVQACHVPIVHTLLVNDSVSIALDLFHYGHLAYLTLSIP